MSWARKREDLAVREVKTTLIRRETNPVGLICVPDLGCHIAVRPKAVHVPAILLLIARPVGGVCEPDGSVTLDSDIVGIVELSPLEAVCQYGERVAPIIADTSDSSNSSVRVSSEDAAPEVEHVTITPPVDPHSIQVPSSEFEHLPVPEVAED
eukprot:CAMPEP_0170587272 /NCGR_PEP_ID=MMETSP0224-20130122/10196_1 /TAXON_ID=285029 /ORGANISM="Togula jolla, Strain CCCM 725" /LENGTH=152 /DNA_ID=CAMNT_0010910887 /DNA_START=401 /DNA_END=858 /DNA_ORIENTATION=-